MIAILINPMTAHYRSVFVVTDHRDEGLHAIYIYVHNIYIAVICEFFMSFLKQHY